MLVLLAIVTATTDTAIRYPTLEASETLALIEIAIITSIGIEIIAAKDYSKDINKTRQEAYQINTATA